MSTKNLAGVAKVGGVAKSAMLRLMARAGRSERARVGVAGRRRGAGFTLLEMMLVVLIIGMLATVSVVAIGARMNAARESTTKVKLSELKTALLSYQMEYAAYPERLEALVPKFIEKVPKDAWGKDFFYSPTGATDPSGAPRFELISTGRSGERGGQDNINVWTMDAAPSQ
ncbi:MAG: type II secretion system protein GspG [Phycisphaerales bacterium]|nr:type II secretion system protein GspG [Phycisphaerales bacterium]